MVLRFLSVLALLFAAPAAPTSSAANGIPECGGGGTARTARLARSSDLDFAVAYVAEPSSAGTRVGWRVTLRNRTRKAVVLSFPTSQYADVIVRRGGERRHRWSSRKAFFQAFTARTLGPRETYTCTLRPTVLELEPGRYELIAYLTSTTRIFLRRSLIVRG
jgi:hypothetical protein